jgi:hypothetical protein
VWRIGLTQPKGDFFMDKRQFLASTALAGVASCGAGQALAKAPGAGPVVLTVGGPPVKSNRGALDGAFDQLMLKHGVKFTNAHGFDATALMALPAVRIKPTLEYDSQPHELAGPLLSSVLGAAGVPLDPSLRLGLRAIDGYNVVLSLADIQTYKMILALRMDGRPLPLGGLGPQWAVYDADALPAFKDKPIKERFALCPWGLYYIDVAAW